MIQPYLFYFIIFLGTFIAIRYHRYAKKHSKHFFIPIIYSLILFIIISTQIGNALPFAGFSTDTGMVGKGNGYFANENLMFNITNNRNIFIITEKDYAYIVEPIGYAQGTSSVPAILKRGNNDLRFSFVASDGYLYFIDGDGVKKKKSRDNTYPALANDTTVGGTVLLIYSSSQVHKIYEHNSEIYFVDLANSYLKKFDLVTYQVVFVASWGFAYIYAFVVLDNNDVIYMVSLGNNIFVKKWNLSGVKDIRTIITALDYRVYTTAVFTTKNYYYMSFAGSGARHFVSNDSYTDVVYRTGYPLDSDRNDMEIGEYTNIVLYAIANLNQYDTFNFIEAGISTVFSPVQLIYKIKDVESVQNTYAQNQNIDMAYSIKVDLYESDLSFNEFLGQYDYRIELVRPDGIVQDSRDIINFKEEGLIFKDAVTQGTFTYMHPDILVNGTWNVKLYEINTSTLNKAQLDTDTFVVLPQNVTAGGIIPTGIQESATNPLANPYFALIIIYAAFIGVGCAFIGTNTGGIIIGSALGTIVTFNMGLMPVWGLFLYAIAVILAFAIETGKSFTNK